MAQEFNKDAILIKSKKSFRAKRNITITLENRTGLELLRLNPMSPLQVFKWDGKIWEQVTQVGYCSCGILPCPPPPEQLPFFQKEVIVFEWNQMESRCIDMQHGLKEYKWAGRGKFKVIFELKKDRDGESFLLEKTFTVR